MERPWIIDKAHSQLPTAVSMINLSWYLQQSGSSSFSILGHKQGPVMIYWVSYLSQDRSSRFHVFEGVNYKNLAENMGFVFKDTLWSTDISGSVCLYPTAFMDSLGPHCVFKKKSIQFHRATKVYAGVNLHQQCQISASSHWYSSYKNKASFYFPLLVFFNSFLFLTPGLKYSRLS